MEIRMAVKHRKSCSAFLILRNTNENYWNQHVSSIYHIDKVLEAC